MGLDSKKFIATADGTSIRLFPENDEVMSRPLTEDQWAVRIDKWVPKELALLIFGEYHTNDKLRWGEKDEVLDVLNALLEYMAPCGLEQVDDTRTTDWEFEQRIAGHFIWVRWQRGEEIYQCTITNCPPQTDAGYRDLGALLKLKGIRSQAPGFEQAG